MNRDYFQRLVTHPYLDMILLAKNGLHRDDYRPDRGESIGMIVGRWFKKQIYKNEFGGISDGYVHDDVLGWAVLAGILYQWRNEADAQKGIKNIFVENAITFDLNMFLNHLDRISNLIYENFNYSYENIYYYRTQILNKVCKKFSQHSKYLVKSTLGNIRPKYNAIELPAEILKDAILLYHLWCLISQGSSMAKNAMILILSFM